MKRTPSPLDQARAARLREERDLDAEFEAHLAHRIDDLVREGLDEGQARQQALAEFGDAQRLKSESLAVRSASRKRDARASAADALLQDIAHSLRQLRRAPGFGLTAVATFMLGVGATATIVSVVNAVVLEPLPFEQPERVVFAEMLTPEGARFPVSEPAFVDWRGRARSFSDMASVRGWGATLRSPGQPRSVTSGQVSHSFLDVLGIEPAIGRMFTADEDLAGEPAAVALISYDMWSTDFARDRSVLGTRLDLDGRRFEVVGVMPERLDVLTRDMPVFTPLGADPDLDRGDHDLTVVARLADGATFERARTELEEIQRGLGEVHADEREWSATLFTSDFILIGASNVRAGWVLLTAAGLLLLMACVNVSNLLVVRATARQAEIGLRAALGASRGRIVRQLFTESGFLAALGGGAGILLAVVLLPVVRTLGEGRIPRLDRAELDGTALAACVTSIAIATLLCGLAPLVQLRSGVVSTARGSHRGGSDRGLGLRSLLVGAQVAMTVVLLAGTGLLMRSFIELSRVDPGFDAAGTLAVRLDMPDASFTWQERAELVPQLREAVASLPGVAAVGATAVDPFSGMNLSNFVASAERVPDRQADFTPISWRVVTPGFFEAMGMEMRTGRGFRDGDAQDATSPVVIGEGLARAMWGDEPAIDRVLVWGDPDGTRMRVVGVVEALRDVALGEEGHPTIYRLHQEIPWAVMTLVARVEGDPASVAAGIRQRIQGVVPGLPVAEIRSLEDNLHQAIAQPRFNLQLLSSFAIAGLLLAVLGLYGVTAFDVRRRFREIGIRLSLGAEPEGIRRMILRQRMTLTAVGSVVGLVAAWLLTSGLQSQLYGITRSDPITWLGVLGVVVAASTLATYLPVRKATDVDPREVLNGE